MAEVGIGSGSWKYFFGGCLSILSGIKPSKTGGGMVATAAT